MSTAPWLRHHAQVRASLRGGAWPWAEANAGAIAANWAARRAVRPRLFNGRVLVVTRLHPDGQGGLDATFLEVDYAALLAWLDAGAPEEAGVLNGFAMGALQGADGAFLLGQMADHTANAGRLYFPAGTPDLSDARADGAVDLLGSVTRELEEETGLGAADYQVGEGWVLAQAQGRLAFLKPIRLHEAAETARARILAAIADDPERELADIVVVRTAADIDAARVPAFLQLFLEQAFAGMPAA